MSYLNVSINLLKTSTNRDQFPQKVYQDQNLKIVIAVTLMAVLGSSSIGPALPALAQDFKIPSERIGLVIAILAKGCRGETLHPFIFNPFYDK